MGIIKVMMSAFVALSIFALILSLTELAYEKFINLIFGKGEQ